jgi:hypothetical protein
VLKNAHQVAKRENEPPETKQKKQTIQKTKQNKTRAHQKELATNLGTVESRNQETLVFYSFLF